MFDWLSSLWQHNLRRRHPSSSDPRPRFRPGLENLEDRTVLSTTTVLATPNPSLPDNLISFPVTIATQNPNATILFGSFTLTDDTTGVRLDSRDISVSGSPGVPIKAEFTISAKLGLGDHKIVARYTSKISDESSSQGSVVEHIGEEGDTGNPPRIRRFLTVRLKNHRIKQVLKITNRSKTPISGNMFLVVDGLNPNITLVGAGGVTTVHPPLGSPFKALGHRRIKPHKFIKVTLIFDDPLDLPLAYTPRLLVNTTP